MSAYRLLLFILVPALAVEAAIFYLLVGFGADEDLIICIEMIWLVVVAALGAGVFGRYDRGY